MKKEYLEKKKEREANREKQAGHYAHGLRTGLPHKDFQNAKENHQKEDQELRNQIHQKSKEIYNSQSPLKEAFGKATNQGRLKNHFDKTIKDFDKER